MIHSRFRYPILALLVSGTSDFIISAGGCLTTAMLATGSTTMPSTAVLLLSIVTGLIAGARRLQALLAPAFGSEPQMTRTTETVEHTVTGPAKEGPIQ